MRQPLGWNQLRRDVTTADVLGERATNVGIDFCR